MSHVATSKRSSSLCLCTCRLGVDWCLRHLFLCPRSGTTLSSLGDRTMRAGLSGVLNALLSDCPVSLQPRRLIPKTWHSPLVPECPFSLEGAQSLFSLMEWPKGILKPVYHPRPELEQNSAHSLEHCDQLHRE